MDKINILPRGGKWLHRIMLDDLNDGQIIRVPGSLSLLTSCCWRGEYCALVAVNEKKSTRDIQIRKISFQVKFEDYPESAMNLDNYHLLGSTSDAIYFYRTARVKERIKIKRRYETPKESQIQQEKRPGDGAQNANVRNQ